MKRTTLLGLTLGLCLPLSAAWYDGGSGSATTGPGAGGGGILINDVATDTGETFVEAILTNVENMMSVAQGLTGGKGGQNDEVAEIEKAIGGSTTGSKVEEFKSAPDGLNLLTRRQMLSDLKKSPDAHKYAAMIAYLEALQTNEARMMVYHQRINTLIKVNNSRLNFTERVKLAAEMNLLGGQMALANQEMKEVANRAIIAGSERRRLDAELAAERRRATKTTNAVLAVP